jgi:Dolichyl-phosphate-mannose-protein mannosyltransferase
VNSKIDIFIRRHENLILVIALVVVTAFSVSFARYRPFWLDEYLVYDTATLSSPAVVWDSLKTAPLSVDPPLYHFLIHYWLRTFGPTEFATRMPSVLAYTIVCFLLYRFVRKYSDIYTGLTVVILCLTCGTFRYAHEARPYALVVAADVLSLLCWANIADDQKNRVLALVGMWVGIVIAVGSHWYGCLVLVPLALGELVRTWQRGKLDLAVWSAQIIGAATVIAYLPLLKAASEYKALPVKTTALGDVVEIFYFVIAPCVVPLTVFIIIAALARFMFGVPRPRLHRLSISTPVFISTVGFALVSFPAFLLGKFVSHGFMYRYAIVATIGILVLLSQAIRSAVGRSAVLMTLAILIFGGYTCFSHVREVLALRANTDESVFASTAALAAQPSFPIVPGDEDLFLRLEAHGSASLRERCVYLTDRSSVRILHHNWVALTGEGFKRWTHLPVRDLSSFLNSYQQFYVIGRLDGGRDWILQRMLEEHAEIALQGTFGGDPVYIVTVR